MVLEPDGRRRSAREIGGQTIGIVGLGHIGREVAWRAAALGCRVLAVNRTMREKPAPVEHVFSWAELDRMLGAARSLKEC